jgi:hypothetical protein
MERYKRKFEEVTIIDFSVKLNQIKNLHDLPKETQQFLYREIDNFTVHGFQEINGYIKRQGVISLGGHWIGDKPENEKFEINSYGTGHLEEHGLEDQYKNMPKQWEKK